MVFPGAGPSRKVSEASLSRKSGRNRSWGRPGSVQCEVRFLQWFEQESCAACEHLCALSECTNLFGMTSPTSLSTRDIVSAPRDANQRPLCRPRRKSVPRKPAILDKNSHAFRDVRGHTANDGPCAQLMVSACRAIGPRLSKGGLCRRHLGGGTQRHLTSDQRRHERQPLLGAYNYGVKPPPHSNKPKEPIAGRSYKCPFGG